MFYVYLLKSDTDTGFYIGFSSDLRRRYQEHVMGKVDSTKHRRPLALIYYEAYSTQMAARDREEKLKQFGSAYVGLLKRLSLK